MTWVHDRIFAAGGGHIPETWASFADQTGVTAVLHLSPVRPARFLGPAPEAFLWLDVADEFQVDLEERNLAARFVHDCLGAGRRLLIHSSLGRQRTRWVYVAYAISVGGSVRATLRQVEERPWLSPYLTDTVVWQVYEESVRSNQAVFSPSERGDDG